MTAIDWADLPTRELMPGFAGRFVHSGAATFAYWEVAEGAVLPDHNHPHEQVVNVLDGQFELTVDGVTVPYGPGRIVVIAPFARHSGRALTACRILDVFTPVREEYR